jgi:hypothetical protein
MNREVVDNGKNLVVEGVFNYYFGNSAVILFY